MDFTWVKHTGLSLLAEKSKQTLTCVRDKRPAVRTIWAVSISGGTPLWYLCCKFYWSVLCVYVFFQTQIWENNPLSESTIQALLGLRNLFPFQISLTEPVWRKGARLRIPANPEPSQVSQLEKFTTSSRAPSKKSWIFWSIPGAGFPQSSDNRKAKAGIIRRKAGERRSFQKV